MSGARSRSHSAENSFHDLETTVSGSPAVISSSLSNASADSRDQPFSAPPATATAAAAILEATGAAARSLRFFVLVNFRRQSRNTASQTRKSAYQNGLPRCLTNR